MNGHHEYYDHVRYDEGLPRLHWRTAHWVDEHSDSHDVYVYDDLEAEYETERFVRDLPDGIFDAQKFDQG